MPSDNRGVSNENEVRVSGQPRDTLQGCLIGADAEQSRREARVRRRALFLSTALQATILLAVVAIPFFGKVESIASTIAIPIPPYRPLGNVVREHPLPAVPRASNAPTFCLMCPARPRMPISALNGRGGTTEAPMTGDPFGENPEVPCAADCINLGNTPGPVIPETPKTPAMVRVTHIDPAMLMQRVEPVYPAIPKQIHRSGRVELHAIISTDGRIESLEVVSGDVLFYQSALDAVRRWRYRPTILNGEPVKVDTYITVIYTLQ